MSKKLKGVIFSIDKVLATGSGIDAKIDEDILFETGRLIKFLLSKNLKPVVLANRDWTLGEERLQDVLTNKWGEFPWFIANRDNTPHKPSANAIKYVLKNMGWDTHETIYVGNTDADMKTAVNGGVLFLNATWYEQSNDYGFKFDSPRDIARFIDIFCLREYLWQYSVCYQDLEYYALGIYGTREPEYSTYTQDAKEAAKLGRGHLDFWLKYLLSSIYFSGLHERINYIAPYPAHKKGSSPTVMEEALVVFAKCFRTTYLKGLIIRHTEAKKSAFARYNKEPLDCFNQLNTIRLNEYPLKGDTGQSYKKSPLKKGKTVLVIDDFCTQGYSLEAARAYVEQTGAKAICLSLLKTINRDYEQINKINKFLPFQVNQFSSLGQVIRHRYEDYILNPSAHEEIGSKLSAYDNWKWPSNI